MQDHIHAPRMTDVIHSPDHQQKTASSNTSHPIDHLAELENKMEKGVLEVASAEEQASTTYLVSWDNANDPTNPLNWSTTLKWGITILVSLGEFITMMSGSMLAPALSAISYDMEISSATAGLVLSVILLAFAFGPMILAPFSEIYGRRPIWLICGMIYSAFNVLCGFSRNIGTLVAARLISGVGASVSLVISLPVLWDMWPPQQRGLSFAIVSVAPVLGPALGPLIGGAVTQTIGWQWIFWCAAIANGILIVACVFLFPETSAAKILGDKARKLRKETGRPYHTEYDGPAITFGARLWTNLSRPIRMLATQPILILISVIRSYTFGTLYFLLSTFASLWTEVYHQTPLDSGLHYIAMAIGFTVAEQVGALLMDRAWLYLRKQATATDDGKTVPEYRVPLLIPGAILVPTGLLWYGWAAQARVHWIVPDIGIAVFSCGFMLSNNALSAYALDAFEKYTASASAASQVMRMCVGFAFPIFAPVMYAELGWGWADTIMALLGLVFMVPAPWILWKFGARIRSWGKPLD